MALDSLRVAVVSVVAAVGPVSAGASGVAVDRLVGQLFSSLASVPVAQVFRAPTVVVVAAGETEVARS